MTITTENIEPSTTAIVERFHSVLYPFPMEQVLETLPKQGWIVPFAERDESGVKLSGAPSKGNVRLVFDLSLRTFGVRGIACEETLAEFRAVSRFVEARFGLAPEVQSFFTEFRFTGTVDAGHEKMSPPEQLADWWSGHRRSEAFAAVLSKWLPGDELGAYGVRMATKGKDANRPEWAELTIAPSSTSGGRFYNFDLVYRSHDRERVESVATSANGLIVAAVEELER